MTEEASVTREQRRAAYRALLAAHGVSGVEQEVDEGFETWEETMKHIEVVWSYSLSPETEPALPLYLTRDFPMEETGARAEASNNADTDAKASNAREEEPR